MAAAKREKKIDPVVRTFVAALMDALHVEKTRGLADVLGLAKADAEATVGKWVRGEHGPSFHYNMRLLELAGWLTPEALRAYGREVPPEVTAEEAEQATRRVASGSQPPDEQADQREKR